jgi:hypothetical protein
MASHHRRTRGNTNSDSRRYADAYADSDPDGYSDGDTYANRYTNSDGDPNPDGYTNSDRDANTVTDTGLLHKRRKGLNRLPVHGSDVCQVERQM